MATLGGEADYTSQILNSGKSEVGALYTEFFDGNVKKGEDQYVSDLDALSYIRIWKF